MKTDRELLELAAKAAGYTVLGVECIDEYSEARYAGSIVLECKDEHDWPFSFAPLDDDGDCARLEVSCELQVDIGDIGVISERLDGTACFEKYADHDGDKNKARRRASVRAAAAIGESMP